MSSRAGLLSVDTNVVDFPQEIDALSLRCQEWELEHAKMKERPPKDARNYLNHVRNILPLFEGLAEIHPVMKLVVVTFRAVINFQLDRIENDLRVYNVLLTVVDMMDVILEVHLVAQRRKDSSVINSNERLLDRLRKIVEDIKECGNAIDTYYKESRLVKFIKSQEWKQRMMDFNKAFIEHRTALLQLLSNRMAQGVDDLQHKMDALLAHAFNTNQDWEKKVQKQLRQYDSLDSWISDLPKVRKLLDLTEDPSIDPNLFGYLDSKEDSDENRKHRSTPFVAALKDDLESTVIILCEKNMQTFTKKLDYHTQQLQEAISRAATYVVDQLSGPHGRLHHEVSCIVSLIIFPTDNPRKDLKKLWKEMNWIFCVDKKVFSMALHEYYLDRFSVKLPQAGEAPNIQKRDEDQWTLNYLGVYGEEICQAVDRDLSDYIRISEVNAFTDEIPEGWTFPQWCVYQGLGWHYEQQIYQKGLQYLLDTFYSTLPHVTPWNRANVEETGKYLGLLHNLSRGPMIRSYDSLPPRFMEQIRLKITKQSERYRAGFKALGYHVDSDDTVRMLFEHKPVESYILLLCVLIMEHCVNVANISKHYTVDIREWFRIFDNTETVRTLVYQRINNLESTFKAKGSNLKSSMETFKDGLYRVCYLENFNGFDGAPEKSKWGGTEVECRYSDFDILDNVHFPPVREVAPESDPSEMLAYPTWESHNPDADPDEVPPAAWTDNEAEAQYYASLSIESRDASSFPRHLRRCNNCFKSPIIDMACYHCIDCKDYDLCGQCFVLPFDSLNTNESVCEGKHLADHALMKMILSFPNPYHHWVKASAKYEREQEVQYGFFGQPRSGSSGEEGGKPPAPVVCTQCQNLIVSPPFYKCLHRLCKAVYLCHECEEHHDFPSDSHTEDEYFNVDDSGLTGNTPLGSSFVYQDDQQGDEGENDSEGGQAEEDEGALDEAGEGEPGEEGEDEEDEEDEANPPVPESIAGSEAPAEDGATISLHRSWHTLLVFPNQVAEEEPEHDSSSQGAHDQIDLKPSDHLGPDADDKAARLESRIGSLESCMNELKEMLAELLAR